VEHGFFALKGEGLAGIRSLSGASTEAWAAVGG